MSQSVQLEEMKYIKKKIDYVLVTSKSPTKYNNLREQYLQNLETNGLEIEEWTPADENDIYYLIHTPKETLLKTAEKIKIKFPIKKNDLVEEGLISNGFKKIGCLRTLPDDVSLENERSYFTMAYSAQFHDKFTTFFKSAEDTDINDKDRILLTYEILSRTTYETHTSLIDEKFNGIESLLQKQCFTHAFPLHDKVNFHNKISNLNDREKLSKYWSKWKRLLTYQPLNLIRRYFGEQVAFYFAWLGFYTTSLFLPAILGALVIIYGALTYQFDIPTNDICSNRTDIIMCPTCDEQGCKTISISDNCIYSKFNYIFDNPVTIIFSLLMSVWSAFYIELWKRKESFLQFEWDTDDLDSKIEPIRPEFASRTKKTKINPITKKPEPYYPLHLKVLKYFISSMTVIFLVLVVVGFIFAIILYRAVINVLLNRIGEDFRKYSSILIPSSAAIINFILIKVLGFFYGKIAVFLTDNEYHRTNSEYQTALTIKLYIFELVNTFGSLFYIAFIKGRNLSLKIDKYDLREQCHPAGCFIDLTIQLAIFLIFQQIINNLIEIVYPAVKTKICKAINRVNEGHHQWEIDRNLEKWDNNTLFSEYQEMAIQFGFISMFIVSFPLGPLFCFLNNLAEIRIDAIKILKTYQRPVPIKAKSIGVWLPIIKIISKIGVITNGFIIAFTSEFIPKFLYTYVFNYGNGTLDGYLEYSLSYKNLTDFGFVNVTNEICRYKDFRQPYDSPNKYEYTKDFYIILCARLVFVIVFEHFVFGIVSFIDFIIPDKPSAVQDQIQREAHIVQQTIWNPNINLNDL